jgi:SAM-dependent methyltransferase
MQAYGAAFSRIYNLRWGNFATRAAPLLRAYYQSTLKESADGHHLLDLCCGTGQLSSHFLENGYQATGLDLSQHMLDYARENCAAHIIAGQAQFIQGNAANYHLDQPVHLAVSTFDALNHLPDLEALNDCFACTWHAVNPGGMFIFDLNTRLGLRRWSSTNIEENPDLTLFTHGLYDEISGRAYTRIHGFIRAEDGRYDRFDETAYNTAFDLAQVFAGLASVGWKQIHFALLTDLATPLVEPELENRVFVIANK